jgi:regulatory protein
MRIEKITPSKKHQDVYYLDFEDGKSLRVGINQIADFSLFTGRELTDEEYDELTVSASRWSCLTRAMKLAGYRPLSRKELIDKLLQKGETPEATEYAADRLESLGVINDRDYSHMIVRHYAAKGYGAGRIRNELYARGVPRDYWDDALAGIPDQSETIEHLIDLKLRTDNPDRKELKKLTDYLYRRGFSWDEIRSALDGRLRDSD